MLAGMCLSAPESACAQLSRQEKQRIASTIAAEINRSINAHQKEGIALREKVIGRLIQCGAIFIMMSKQLDDPEAKKRIQDVAEISYDLSVRISEGVAVDRFSQIGDAAQKLLMDKFAAERTPDSEREMDMVLRNCKSFHELAKLPGAVAELLPPGAQQNAAAIEFSKELSKELQECLQYNILLAGYYLTQVPQSQPLSPSDEDKAVRAMTYRFKSKQIDVLMKEFEPSSGMTDAELKTRANAMFEQIKEVMGPDWNVDKLHARYKVFCQSLLSKEGLKRRTEEILQRKICGGLYKCW
ncbi:MAG: hypothetical protein WCC30_16345 [Candidatus Dormiibacterota bacterium]